MTTTLLIPNFEYDLMKTELAKIRLEKVTITSNGRAKTVHSIYSVGEIDGKEVEKFQKTLKYEFEYKGVGHPFEEALEEIKKLITDPNT